MAGRVCRLVRDHPACFIIVCQITSVVRLLLLELIPTDGFHPLHVPVAQGSTCDIVVCTTMPLFSDGNSDVGGLSRSMEACHQTCILVQRPNSIANGQCTTHPSAMGSLKDTAENPPSESEGYERSFPASASKDLFWRLALIIGLALPLLVAGLLLFVNGFFLSRDDLPYISNGRALPFPPLFPHLDPAPLHLNREEGTYYVDTTAENRRGVDKPFSREVGLMPLDLGSFLSPRVDSNFTEADICRTGACRSSWVSVTPYDRVVILLIDAMRFDFLLWDPEASNACGNDAASECAPAPPGLRPFYRNRVPFVHDLLRRTDTDLLRFLASFVGRQQALSKEDGEDRTSQVRPIVNLPTERPMRDSFAADTISSYSASDWGGNHFTRLYIFEADPPTATTQRLTGLATGSMPSFFSVRFDFCHGRAQGANRQTTRVASPWGGHA